MDDTLHTEVEDLECILEGSKKPGALSYELLLLITGHFSDERVIVKDGLATTYRVSFFPKFSDKEIELHKFILD